MAAGCCVQLPSTPFPALYTAFIRLFLSSILYINNKLTNEDKVFSGVLLSHSSKIVNMRRV